jgi:hypothetical protein
MHIVVVDALPCKGAYTLVVHILNGYYSPTCKQKSFSFVKFLLSFLAGFGIFRTFAAEELDTLPLGVVGLPDLSAARKVLSVAGCLFCSSEADQTSSLLSP